MKEAETVMESAF